MNRLETLLELVQEQADKEARSEFEDTIRDLQNQVRYLQEAKDETEKRLMSSFMQSSRIKSVTQKTETPGIARALNVTAVFRGPDGIEITVE